MGENVTQPDAGKPKKKVGCLKVFGIGVGLIVLLIVIVAVASGGGDSPSTTATDDTSTSAPKAKNADDAPVKIGIGQEAKDGDFTFKVTKVEPGKDQIGGKDFGTKAQGQFVFVHVTVENHGKEAGTFAGDDQHLVDTQGRKSTADTEAAIYLDDSQSLYEQINPGNSLSGIVIFDIPRDAVPDTIELHDSAFSGGVVVNLK